MQPEDQGGDKPPDSDSARKPGEPVETPAAGSRSETEPASRQNPSAEDPYGYYDDPYAYDPSAPYDSPASSSTPSGPTAVTTAPPPAPPAPPSPPKPDSPEEEEEDDEGMLRMSFLEHLEELRKRLIFMLAGLGIAFVLCLTFTERLWLLVSAPAVAALRQLGSADPKLIFTSPTEAFTTIWVKLPMLVSVFVASPWILYQVWAFVAPGLYKRERRWAAPFVICSAGLFIAGGLFAYFVAFRFGLTFLLGIGHDVNVQPFVSITEYFNLFVNVMLGVGIVFELPVLIFFLTLLRIASPSFLIRNSRYAILAIVILAAIVTPTPDVVNLVIFSVPMVLLYFAGVFASYILVLHRENRRFPWGGVLLVTGVLILLLFGAAYFAVTRYGYRLVPHWPYLLR
jgi:sec-independent protein translocase protein TatC